MNGAAGQPRLALAVHSTGKLDHGLWRSISAQATENPHFLVGLAGSLVMTKPCAGLKLVLVALEFTCRIITYRDYAGKVKC